jgi:hypothetical protein
MLTRTGRVVALLGAVFFVSSGAWALVAPSSFYDQLAHWPPYNEHLLHDVGVFQIGLGVSLATVLTRMSGTVAVLAGGAAAAVLHFVSHVIDYGEGGQSSDPYVLGVVALAFVLALIAETRRSGR